MSVTALHPRELARATDVLGSFTALRDDPYPWLLESSLIASGLGRYSFFGADPYLVVRSKGELVEVECLRAVRPGLERGTTRIEADPFEAVRSLLPPAPEELPSGLPPFVGGAVGYWGYELAQHLEPLVLHGRDDLDLPDLMLLLVDRVVAVDHIDGRSWVFGLGFGSERDEANARASDAAEAMLARLPDAPRAERSPQPLEPLTEIAASQRLDVLATPLPRSLSSDFDPGDHAKAVATILDEIAAGNVYQANLTHRMQLPFAGEPWALYCALRDANPSPFSAYFELPEVAIASSSPERFLRVDPDRAVESRPIKGTRPRGRSSKRDSELAAELAASEKDRAENLMIVDLVRNDLGRVCEIGSVEVSDLMAIEAYATVFQMVSTVRGRLARGRDVTDAIRAAFPPGSMTGAPKIAAMRLLDRLEPLRRGIYAGSIGYLDVRGGADLSVVIRTVLISDGKARFHVGGGIVADSDAVEEYCETLDKARALWVAAVRADAKSSSPPNQRTQRTH